MTPRSLLGYIIKVTVVSHKDVSSTDRPSCNLMTVRQLDVGRWMLDVGREDKQRERHEELY